MNAPMVSPTLFLPVGNVLLLGATGYSLFQVIRGEAEFSDVMLSVLIGLVGVTFFESGFLLLTQVFDQITSYLASHMNRDTLSEQLVQAIRTGRANSGGALPDAGEVISQVWRSGVWGVVSSFVELLYMVADLLIEASQKVFFEMIRLIFPIAAGIFPILPRIFLNLVAYAIELCLWRPLIIVIHEVTSMVGRQYLAHDSTQGLRILSVEVVAVILILSIPAFTHKIVSGAMAGDFGAGGGMVKLGNRLYGAVSGMIRGRAG